MPPLDGTSGDALRLAAFDALGRIIAPTGGVIRREEMSAGFEFAAERIPFANRAVGIWTPRQLHGGAPLSITTTVPRRGVMARYDDAVREDDGWFRYRYQGDDPDNHFNRSLRTAHRERTPLIYFYGLASGVYEALFPVYVMEDHPGGLAVLVAPDVPAQSGGALLHGGSEAPLKAYVTRTVKQRLHQHRFRELVVGAYGHRCAVCRIGARDRLVSLLDAAHIIADRDQRGLPEIPNGLSLCKMHHSAYDLNIVGIAPDLRIHVREDILAERDGPMLQHGIKEMQGRSIEIPSITAHQPRAEYLDERYRSFLAA